MGQRGFHPNMSHELIFQISAQSNKEIQSYSSANAGYQNGVLIMVSINEL